MLFVAVASYGDTNLQATAVSVRDNVVLISTEVNDRSVHLGIGLVVGQEQSEVFIITPRAILHSRPIFVTFFGHHTGQAPGEVLPLVSRRSPIAVLRATPPAGFSWRSAIMAQVLDGNTVDDSSRKTLSIGINGEWYIPEKSGSIIEAGSNGSIEIEDLKLWPGSIGAPIVSAAGAIGMMLSATQRGTVSAMTLSAIKETFENEWNLPWLLTETPVAVGPAIDGPKTERAPPEQTERAERAETALQRSMPLLDRGELDRALTELSAGIQVAPTADLFYARALVLMDLDRNEEASRDLESALDIEDDWILRRSVQRLGELIGKHMPWGYLTNLSTSEYHRLTQEEVSIGRSIPSAGIVNDVTIDDPTRLVSRRHAVIRKDRTVEDLRSTNGTTINARHLTYGSVTSLADGDLIVLASTQALRFTTDNPNGLRDQPSGTWGILIDGLNRRFFYLSESVYSLYSSDGGVSPDARNSEDAIFVISKRPRGIEVFDPLDQWSARVTIRHSDRDYESFELDSDTSYELIGFPIELEHRIGLGAVPANIVFQIVVFR